MKIAQIAPIIERVPPKKYGGTERVVYTLTEGLVKRGYDVTLFASGDSQTQAKLVSVFPKGLREARMKNLYGPNITTLYNLGLAYSRQDKFDLIHDHTAPFGVAVANIAFTPTVLTLHGAITTDDKKLYQTLNRPYYVSISKAQRKPAPSLHYAATIYNGLDFSNYPFSPSPDSYLLFVGRICLEKGVHIAIEVAQYLDLPLIIAAKLEEADLGYFKQYIEPRLSETVRWIGEVTEAERNKLMAKALCLLHPITWAEPFGLTMIEAMACGCPVIAMKLGSVPELIANGKTGFIVSDIDEMISAVLNLDKINRQFCRDHARKNFNQDRMVTSYIKVYNKIVNSKRDQLKIDKKNYLLI